MRETASGLTEDGFDREDTAIYGLYIGQVVANDDPDRIGRVRVKVPGLLEGDGTWAMPIGVPGGGHTDRGLLSIPAVGATVGILFVQGDVDDPVYLPGPYGYVESKTDIPSRRVSTETIDASAKAFDPDAAPPNEVPQRHAWASANWGVYLDDKDDLLVIRHKTQDVGISISAKDRSLVVFGTTMVQIKAEGLVDIDGARVQIAGRVVAPTGRPI